MKVLMSKMPIITDRPMIVAEISCNHKGGLDTACKLLNAAKSAGADAVKIQLYNHDEMVVDDDFYIGHDGTPWDGMNLKELYRKAETSRGLAKEIFRHARKIDMPIFSSVFSKDGADYLEHLDCPVYKISSFESNHYPLIEYVANKGKPLLISIGMADDEQVMNILNSTRGWHHNLTLLHCVSAYPTNTNELGMARIPELRKLLMDNDANEVSIGFSDHSGESYGAMVATAMKCSVIEKHLILSYESDTFDKQHSATEFCFAGYVHSIKTVARSLHATNNPETAYTVFKRSIYAIRDISQGEAFTMKNVGVFRPYRGLDPIYLPELLTRKSSMPIMRGMAVRDIMVEGGALK